jgi:putative tricarboxylic transport membrane protein
MTGKEWVVPFALLLVGVASSIEAWRLGLGSVHSPGVGFLPFLVGVSLSLLALCSLIIDITAARTKEGKDEFFGPFVMRVVLVVCFMGLYVVLLPVAGYLLSTFLLFVFLFKTAGVRRWSSTLTASLLTTCASYLLFGYWLGIRFPKGFLGL